MTTKYFHTQNGKVVPMVKPGTRILFANVPGDGHFNPLTGLAMHLASIGCDVRWYSSALYKDKIHNLNIQWYPFKKALEVTADNIDNVFPDRRKHKSQVAKLCYDMINFFILRSTEYYADIKEIREEFPFDLMIADIAFSAIPFVKEKLNVPVISIGVFPLVETSEDLPPAGLGMTPSNTVVGRIKQTVLRYVADKILFAKPMRVMTDILAQHGIEAGGSNVFDLLTRKSTLVLQSGTPGFEYKRSDLGDNIRFIGALLPYKKASTQKAWFDERLKQYSKIILVTQGTVERDPEKIIVPTLEAFKNSRYLVVATTGGSKTNELRERFPHENIIIEDFIPFNDIMPYADVYVTNGGYGGVMLGIENKLPMVVGGIHEGKNEINARIGYFKLGINLKSETPSVRQMYESIQLVLTDGTYRNNVIKLHHEFKSYNPNELTATYVAEILQPSPFTIPRHRKQVAVTRNFAAN
jgi:MGT family glycosyltransferase